MHVIRQTGSMASLAMARASSSHQVKIAGLRVSLESRGQISVDQVRYFELASGKVCFEPRAPT